MEASVEILADMIQNSTFPDIEIEKERGVILSEIRASMDDIEDYSFNRINEIAFKKSPLRYDTLGEEKKVKKFTRDQLLDYYKKYYIPSNCHISIVSSYEHREMFEIVQKYFEKWKDRELINEEVIIEDNISIKEISYKNNIEQSTIIYAFTFHGLTREEELALKVLNHKLGESANSILFRELREDRGLVYDVYSHLDMTNSVKTLYIYTAVGTENVDEAVMVIDSCISKIKSGEINFNEDMVMLMKKVLKTAVASTLEDSTDLGNYVIHQSLENESIYEFTDDMRNLELIKSEDIYKKIRQNSDRGKPFGYSGNGNCIGSLNFNMDELHCAIGRVQIKKTQMIAEGRRRVVSAVREGISDIPSIYFNDLPVGSLPSHWFMRMLFRDGYTSCDKFTFCKALAAEGVPVNAYYAATPFTGDWYTKRRVFGNSGYPWAAPEYKGNREKYYTLDDVPNAAKALNDTIMVYVLESWSEKNIRQVCEAFHKVYEAYKL
jgi:predicted Zn-dependent peptidase